MRLYGFSLLIGIGMTLALAEHGIAVGEPKAVEKARRLFKKINTAELDDQLEVELGRESGSLEISRLGESVVNVVHRVPESGCSSVSRDYYYWDGKPVFLFVVRDCNGAKTEDRYYFSGNKLVWWTQRTGPNTSALRVQNIAKALGWYAKAAQRLEDARQQYECAAALGDSGPCNRHGECTYIDSSCIAATDKDCLNSDYCQSAGECTALDGKCIATPQSCRESTQCLSQGLCSLHRGSCHALNDADCKRAYVCEEDGECTAKDLSCVK